MNGDNQIAPNNPKNTSPVALLHTGLVFIQRIDKKRFTYVRSLMVMSMFMMMIIMVVVMVMIMVMVVVMVMVMAMVMGIDFASAAAVGIGDLKDIVYFIVIGLIIRCA